MSWHDGERATVVGGLIIMALAVCYYIALVPHLLDFSTFRTTTGYPLAADFANYWTASKLALAGKAVMAYNLDELYKVQLQVFGTHSRYGSGWYYPPSFLLIVLPLGLMAFLPALVTWVTVTLVLYLRVLFRVSRQPILIVLFLLFPGIFENLIFGQNGCLTGILLGGGLLLLERSPLAAGCLLGLLCYKPHLVILIFPALIFGRYWKAITAAAVISLLLPLTSLAVFGYQVWLAYFKVMAFPMQELQSGSIAWNAIPTVFAATLSLGFGVKAAYLVQGVAMSLALTGVVWVWGKNISMALRGSALVLGTLLFTPYMFVYDLAILALPLGWLWEEGRVNGRLPGELLLLLLGWLMPAAAPALWNSLNVFGGKLQIGPGIILALFLLSLVKAKIALNRSPLHIQSASPLSG